MGVSQLLALFSAFMALCLLPHYAQAMARRYDFNIKMQNVTRLCHTKSIVTVNGKFPGPPIVAREGDRLLIKVTNHVPNNITIHWHGIRQLCSGWADGPAYITQCPIQTGQSYVYNFTIVGQRGTLFWHAHISWLRSTLYGPIIILPKKNANYPFQKPYKEVPIIFGEWFNADPEAIIKQALATGGGPNVSDAYTINGLPGPLYNCSAKDTFKLRVKAGKTYLLRIINAALNDELFFSIANHTLTVVDADAVYVKPFQTTTILITPGQTTNVLLNTKPHFPGATFLMAARPYVTGPGTFDNSTVAGILEYETPSLHLKNLPLNKPQLPSLNDTSFVTTFAGRLRSLASAKVPQEVERRFFFTVGLGTSPCDQKNATCQGPNGTKFAASVNNVSFVLPSKALLGAHFAGQSSGVYSPDSRLARSVGSTTRGARRTTRRSGMARSWWFWRSTRAWRWCCRIRAFLELRDILSISMDSIFMWWDRVSGTMTRTVDPNRFNLVDPVERNTVGVPAGGWVAIRFLADNPGVWFMHCHLEVHTSWGLKMAWLVLDGRLPNQKLLPPPSDLPKC